MSLAAQAPRTEVNGSAPATNLPVFSRHEDLAAYDSMLLIRRFEEKAGQLYSMGLIGGFCHLYIGQEAVVVGMKMASKDGDKVITGYRDHGHMLACGMDAKGVMAEGGSGRVAAVTKLVDSLGGTVESFYFGFGGDDFYVTVDVPSNAAAAAAAMAVAASGGASPRTIVLLTPEEVDAAMKLSPDYRAPGA